MAKAPRAGSVKTRLAGAVGPADAAGLYACFLRDTAELAAEARALRPSIDLAVCYAPDDAAAPGEIAALGFSSARKLAPDIGFAPARMLAQRGETLGDRLTACFGDLFAAGYRTVVAIGADSPTLPARHLADAFALLGEDAPSRANDSASCTDDSPSRADDARSASDLAVVGPSDDGGYYLVGVRRFEPRLFEGVRWSTSDAFADTIAAADRAGLRVLALPSWYDVDTPADLDRLRAELRADAAAAPATRAFLAARLGPL